MRNKAWKLIQLTKETYYLNFGRKIPDLKLGTKSQWPVATKKIVKQEKSTYHSLST